MPKWYSVYSDGKWVHGGSSGHDYLAATAAKHGIFSDFHNISTLLIPRSELPVLPQTVRDNLNFHYSVQP